MLIWRDPCEFDFSPENYTEAYENDANGEQVFVWKDRYFENSLIYRLTDEFYDNEVDSKKGGVTPDKPWLIFFI